MERQLLSDLNLTLKKGEFITLIGGNGAGKSTLFNVIAGFMQPDSGRIIVDQLDITNKPSYERAKDVSKVMQDPKMGTIEQMTIEENMSFAYLRGKSRGLFPHQSGKRRRFFAEKLAMLEMGLENRLDEYVENLSGGQRQALSLIMSILCDCKILLLDEITAALDPKTADQVMRIAARVITEEHLTAMMITHNMHHALEYGERTVLLAQGKLIKEFSQKEKQSLNPQLLAAEFECN